jgi:hypothetical protein
MSGSYPAASLAVLRTTPCNYGPTFNESKLAALFRPGRSSELEILPGRWNGCDRVSGTQLRFSWNDSLEPVLTCENLARGLSSGVSGCRARGRNGLFFQFRLFAGWLSAFLPAEARVPTPGLISDADSEPFALAEADFTRIRTRSSQKPREGSADGGRTGIGDVSRFYARDSREETPCWRKTFWRTRPTSCFGSDSDTAITSHLLERPAVYFGASAYRSRDGLFGNVGFNDNIFLPLRIGTTLLVMSGKLGGWAFCFRVRKRVMIHPSMKKEWAMVGGCRFPKQRSMIRSGRRLCAGYFNEGNKSSPRSRQRKILSGSGSRASAGRPEWL